MEIKLRKQMIGVLDENRVKDAIEDHFTDNGKKELLMVLLRSRLALSSNEMLRMKIENAENDDDKYDLMIEYYDKYTSDYKDDIMKIIQVPESLAGLDYEELKEKMQSVSLRSYKFSVDSYQNYTNAVKVLSIAVTNREEKSYDKYLARDTYKYIKDGVKRLERGYIASDVNPDLHFESMFDEYLYFVDEIVWDLLKIDKKYLVDDDSEIWVHIDVEEACKKIIEYLNSHGIQFITVDGKLRELGIPNLAETQKGIERIYLIFDDAEKKARDILDKILSKTVTANSSIGEFSYINQELDRLTKNDSFKSFGYNVALPTMTTIALIFAAAYLTDVSIPVLLGMFAENAVKFGIGTAAIVSYNDIMKIAEMFSQLSTDENPAKHLLKNPYEKDKNSLDKKINKLNELEDTDIKYLIKENYLKVNKKFSEALTEKIKENNFYPYNEEIYETKLYNLIIKKYLESVRDMNKDTENINIFNFN